MNYDDEDKFARGDVEKFGTERDLTGDIESAATTSTTRPYSASSSMERTSRSRCVCAAVNFLHSGTFHVGVHRAQNFVSFHDVGNCRVELIHRDHH